MSQQPLTTYLDLCTQVYDLSKPEPPPDAYRFYRSYAQEAKGPILEPMCGTGRFLIPLAEEGFAIDGFDASSYMLAVLQAKAKERNVAPRVWQGLLEDLARSDKYGLVIIPAGSFGLVLDRGRVSDAMAKIYHHLAEDGLFVFEVDTPRSEPSQVGIWQGKVWLRPDGKRIVASYLELPVEDNVLQTLWRYELVDGEQIVQTETEMIAVRRYDFAELRELAVRAGFRQVRAVSLFDRTSSPKNDDTEMVIECSK